MFNNIKMQQMKSKNDFKLQGYIFFYKKKKLNMFYSNLIP